MGPFQDISNRFPKSQWDTVIAFETIAYDRVMQPKSTLSLFYFKACQIHLSMHFSLIY